MNIVLLLLRIENLCFLIHTVPPPLVSTLLNQMVKLRSDNHQLSFLPETDQKNPHFFVIFHVYMQWNINPPTGALHSKRSISLSYIYWSAGLCRWKNTIECSILSVQHIRKLICRQLTSFPDEASWISTRVVNIYSGFLQW